MGQHDFRPLLAKYPDVIAQMPRQFSAHAFILRLAHANQQLYVEALHAYRNSPPGATPTPFLIVHRRLAQLLSEFPHLVKYECTRPGIDIFTNKSKCSQWERV